MKVLFSVALATFFVAAYGYNVTWGALGANDQVLLTNFIKKSGSMMKVVTQDVVYNTTNNYTISYIKVRDQIPNGTGGFASLSAGGIGFNSTTIHFKSQRGKGFNFILEIFGRRK